MKIDAHQHFWRYESTDYPWIDARMDVLRRDWLTADLLPLLDTHGIECSIAVQARPSEAETDFLLALARHEPRIAGVVGWVDLRADNLAQRLERWQAAPRPPAACRDAPHGMQAFRTGDGGLTGGSFDRDLDPYGSSSTAVTCTWIAR